MDAVELAARNTAVFWARVAQARGYAVARGDGWAAVTGDARMGRRVVTVGEADPAAVRELAVRPGRVAVEDAFGGVDLGAEGFTSRQLPVMIRYPGAPVGEPRVPVRRVAAGEDLRTAERLVVEGFDLVHFQPYEPGVVFPDALLEDTEVYLAHLDGAPAGACLAVPQDEVVGVYWVTSMPEFRSRGVGRSLMHALLRRFDDRPMVLTASRAGRPLYESLAFATVADANWWTPRVAD
ncbi:GNAT family N-acetyltransferase [Dactylosporangium sp. CA-233914]|uniref:GNAT family N-acetyltransferase n=1 Tax=Dactylosporangium sp. CA-233914 TaxID=3239934 RepID=UPI003D89BE61